MNKLITNAAKKLFVLSAFLLTVLLPSAALATHEDHAPADAPFNYGVLFVIPGLVLIVIIIVYNARKLSRKNNN